MRHIELLDKVLTENGTRSILSGTPEKPKPSVKRIKESDLLSADVDNLVESCMKDVLKTVIKESNMNPELSDLVENTEFTDEQVVKFMEETVDPVLEILGGYKNNRLVKTSDKALKNVPLPVYEIALTLESARMGALTLESIMDKPVQDDVDPDAQDLEDIVDESIDDTYDFGEDTLEDPLNEMADIDVDVHQYEENDDQNIDQEYRHDDEPDFEDESDIEPYENEIAGEPDDDFSDKLRESSVIRKLVESLEDMSEEIEKAYDDEGELVDSEEAGMPDIENYPDSEFEGEGSGDEYINEPNEEEIVEEQLLLARTLLTKIFNEYGIDNQDHKKALVHEAMHYIFKYGIKNLCPAVSDVSKLVIEQNSHADIEGGYTASTLVENTAPVLTDLQEISIANKSLDMLVALSKSKEMTRDASEANLDRVRPNNMSQRELNFIKGGGYTMQESVFEAASHITRSSEIERERQAFRYRMNKFNENAKAYVASCWVPKAITLSESAATLRNDLTIRMYISEGADLKEFFTKVPSCNPITEAVFKNVNRNGDSLAAASLLSEVASAWTAIKATSYNNKDMQSKYVALESTNKIAEKVKSLSEGLSPKYKATLVNMIENFQYRIQSLTDKVVKQLNENDAANYFGRVRSGQGKNTAPKYDPFANVTTVPRRSSGSVHTANYAPVVPFQPDGFVDPLPSTPFRATPQAPVPSPAPTAPNRAPSVEKSFKDRAVGAYNASAQWVKDNPKKVAGGAAAAAAVGGGLIALRNARKKKCSKIKDPVARAKCLEALE